MACASQESRGKYAVDKSGKVKVTILASEWGSSKGGLSTINRELGIQLAKSSDVEISFFVPQCSEKDKTEAHKHNISIVEATQLVGYEELEWLSFPPDDLQIEVVVGHGVKLGRQAQVIRKSHQCKWVQVVHTDPEELGMFKCYPDPICRGEEKHNDEVKLCEKADFVVGIGPKLAEAFRSYLRYCKNVRTIFDFTPGIFEEFLCVEQAPEEGNHRSVLVFGRGDIKDFELKGFDIAGKAVASPSLVDTHLVFVGAPNGKHEEVAEYFVQCGLPRIRLKVRGYDESRESLKKLFCEVDLVLMPSRTDGFGLTGLEALSAGLPVLVSKNSGFGEALCKVPFCSPFVIDSDKPDVWATAIKEIIRDKNRQCRLEEAENMRLLYDKKYSWTKQSDALRSKIIELARACLQLQIDRVPVTEASTQKGTGTDVNSWELQKVIQAVTVPSNTKDQQVEVNAGLATEHCGDGSIPSTQAVFNQIVQKYLRNVDPSNPEQWNGFVCFLQEVRKLMILRVDSGSLLILVEVASEKILEELWQDYQKGHLNKMAQKFLVTEELLEEFGLIEFKLTTFIAEVEYKACQHYFSALKSRSITAEGGEESRLTRENRCGTKLLRKDANPGDKIVFTTRFSLHEVELEELPFPIPRHYLPYVLRDCEIAYRMLDNVLNEHTTFLLLRAFELQGEIESAFRYAIIYKHLDHKMTRDKSAFRRLKEKVMRLCGQGYGNQYHIVRVIEVLMSSAEQHFSRGDTTLAVPMYTEVINLFPEILEAFERRAQCYLTVGDLQKAKQDCQRALNISDRTSSPAFDMLININTRHGELDEALRLAMEWRRMDPESTKVCLIVSDIRTKLSEKQSSRRNSQSQSMTDLSRFSDESENQFELERPRPSAKRPPIRASKQNSGARPKSTELLRDEYRRKQECKEIAQEMEAKLKDKEENLLKKKNTVAENNDRQHSADKINESITTEMATTDARLSKPPSNGSKPFPERTKKRKVRRKTRNLRAKREELANDSDASSVCSIQTCPGDVRDRENPQNRPKMPTFSDIERGAMSDYTKSSSRQTQAHKLQIAKSAIRPRPTGVLGTYQLCWQFKRRLTCSRGQKCTFAHSENERIAWEEDRKKVKKKVKNVKANDGSSLLKDFRVAFRGPANCRAPLRIPGNGGKYRMCPKWPEGKCKLDKRCTLAHGKEELKAWNEHLENMNKRKKEESVKKNARQKNDLTANVSLPNDVPVKRLAPNYKLDELVQSVAGVTVSYEPQELDVSLQIPLNSKGKISHSWTIRVNYESRETGHVQDVVLLPHHHKCYTLSSAKFKCSVPSSTGEPVEVKLPESYVLKNDLHYALKPHLPSLEGSYELEINVAFSTLVFGNFAQVLVLDFGGDSAHLAVKMNVEVGSQEFWQEYGEEKAKLTLDWTLWDDGSRKIVKFEPKQPLPFNNDYLLGMYKLPREDEMVPCALFDKGQGLRPENYKNVMHQLLFIEEFYIRKQIARFNVHQVPLQAAKLVVKKEEVLCAQEGWLYGSFHVARPITPDDADGRLLLRSLFRSLGTVLLAKSEGDSVIYEALVDSVEDSRGILKLSQRCCKELDLSDNSCVTVDIQFHINRLAFCEMHDNIDRLGPEHFRILFPELGNSSSQQEIYPLTWILDKKLNDDQKEIIRKIAAPANEAPPLVVFGPFGTGKTYTLNQAIRRIAVNQDNRVLICTHSNSAADLHVLLLDTYLKNPGSIRACKPLRIYTPLRKLSTVSETVKEYCLIADKGTSNQVFRLPTRDDVIGHRVVISTLGMSRSLFDMNLRHGFFSHILIDEAAQALETETLTPLTLAGNKTKVVFTGDHMQMSPDVFSPQAKKWGLHVSLQERLFYDYESRRSGSLPDASVIFLTENYRSNEGLLQFASDMFYGGGLSSGSSQPLHPQLGPLVFYAALGKEEIEENHASYRNLAEVNEVVKRVKELSDFWPEEWGPKDLKQVAVVSSYRYQVKTIRDGLRKVGLGGVDVETIENVQGKQFRALFVSTVRSYHTCKDFQDSAACETDSPYLYFLSDPKLLNTALTRAQSLVAVVGDPFSLRTIGDCQGLWEEFIKRCTELGTLFGIEHTELEECISLSGLNVNAAVFIPVLTEGNSQPPASANDSFCSSSMSAPQVDDKTNEQLLSSSSFVETNNSNENDLEESNDAYDSGDAGDEMSESDEVGNADDFAEYGIVDETVPPKHWDSIVEALREKCEEKKSKKKLMNEEKSQENAMEGGQDLKQEPDEIWAGVTPLKHNGNTQSLGKSDTRSKIGHGDIKMKMEKGKTRLFLDLTYKRSERSERLTRRVKVKDQECLNSEYLLRLLKDEPELYRKCTLRVGSDRAQTLYGELSDTESEDLLLEGDTRQTFDRDEVVVKLSKEPTNSYSGDGGSPERLRGKIRGILRHRTNLRERQFVCKISRNDPRVLYPVDKSMRPIANLTDESCDGIPIYKKIPEGSDEKTVRATTLSRREALSGKYFFVVQYLQWRREFPRPLGIVTKAIRKCGDLSSDAYKVLHMEYNLKDEFPEVVIREVDRHIHRWERIPDNERESRCLVENAFTIDPPRSKALDDALTIEEVENDCFKVGVHIADVSYYVREGTKIDDEARKRGTSYYGGSPHGDLEAMLMLPSALSHDICSLLPNKERRAVSVYLKLDKHGCIQDEELAFGRSIVKSRCRLTYEQAQMVILGRPVRCDPEDGELTPTVVESIRNLNLVAQAMRKLRLSDASYFHFDHADRKEDIEAHELVEEMMILTNTAVGKYLAEKVPNLLPLRIQRSPKTQKLNEWRNEFRKSAKLSLSLRQHLKSESEDGEVKSESEDGELKDSEFEDGEIEEQFAVPTSTWHLLDKAWRNKDQRELKLLICNDKLYPQLAVAHCSLNSRQRRAEDVIAAEVSRKDRRHSSLKVSEYTRFTSPIRRYFDIVVHRLLLEMDWRERVYDDIDLADVYRQCSFLSEQSSKYEKDCARVEVAGKLVKGSCEFSAVVEVIGKDHDFIRLQLLSDTNQYLTEKQRIIWISQLGPTAQPTLNETSGCLELRWKLRIYDASTENLKRAERSEDLERHLLEDRNRIQALLSENAKDFRTGYFLQSRQWLDVLCAVKESDDDHDRLTKSFKIVNKAIVGQMEEIARLRREREERLAKRSKLNEQVETVSNDLDSEDDKDFFKDDDCSDVSFDENDFQERKKYRRREEKSKEKGQCDADEEDDTKAHIVETSISLKVADTVTVHLSANNSSGLVSPEIQLFNLAPGIKICVEHRKRPDACFAMTASEKATRKIYESIGLYESLWRPVLEMEAATVGVRNDDTIILRDLEVEWKMTGTVDGSLLGDFYLNKNFLKTRQIEISRGDYACVKVHCPMPSSSSFSTSRLTNKTYMKTESGKEVAARHGWETSSGHKENKRGSDEQDDVRSMEMHNYWVGHCILTKAAPQKYTSEAAPQKYTLEVFQSSMEVPKELDHGESKTHTSTVEIIKQTIPSRRMISTLEKQGQEEQHESLAHFICLGRTSRLRDLRIALPSEHLSIAYHEKRCGLNELNNSQVTAVKASLRRRFTLIQGPPGTGKTITGVHIAYWFARINQPGSEPDTPEEIIPDKAPPQVIYCGPSNKSVDVVAEYLMKIPGLKILRIYGNVIEEEAFPIPNQVKPTRKTSPYGVRKNLEKVALHFVIRDETKSPAYAGKLKQCEDNFERLKKAKEKIADEDVDNYLKLIHEAERWVIRSVREGHYYQVILCTCSAAGSHRILAGACNNTIQCIVDEAGMCMEPETLIPIAWSKAEQVVLIGDHKQLQPIVKNKVARSLGLNVSLFERYSDMAMMLQKQYRMHKDICEFPSRQFYEGNLRTAGSVRDREMNRQDVSKKVVNFWPNQTGKGYVPLAFCNVVGEEEELVVTTEEGNERSKSNKKEKEKVVEVIKKLIGYGVTKDQIIVLTPYRAQCHLISEDLDSETLPNIPVMSIVKSQGSESDYVIISLVRSLPLSQINPEPNGAWLREKLGFVTDEHQINVALTRAKRGLVIIGNKNLLEVCDMWSDLIEHYQEKSCLADGDHWPGP
ncbi:3'-5' exoribonuclease HELZ2-like isoform X3 [Montipora capricornis]|uniref:3'-5' exoribonuclease HELZ2-like isoform X3 n=1 Tax=Montipora capricornis TaxID=246305 RepID=UPI0035F134F4